jgi:hypothetical protein
VEVEAHRPHARSVELADLLIRGAVKRNDADEPGPEPLQRILQPTKGGLTLLWYHSFRLYYYRGVRPPLEGAGDDGSAGDVETGGRGAVVVDGERVRDVALVGDERNARVDDVEVAVEDS